MRFAKMSAKNLSVKKHPYHRSLVTALYYGFVTVRH